MSARGASEGGTPRRLFTDAFRLRQRVHVIRTEHGWFDGNLLAEIVELAPDRCVVVEVHGDRPSRIEHVIRKPRDIRPA